MIGRHTVPLGDFDSNGPDVALGEVVDFQRDRPPLGSFVIGPTFDGYCFIIKDNRLYFCLAKQPEAWPALNFIEVDAPEWPGKTGVFHNGQLHYLTVKDIWGIQGTGQNSFQPVKLNAKTGAQSIRGAVSVTGKGIYHVGPDGIYIYSAGNDVKVTEETLEPIFRGEDTQGLPGVTDLSTSFLWHFQNHLYFGYASANTYPSNLLVTNLDTMRTVHYAYNDGSPIQVRAIQTDHVNNRLLIGDSTGFIRVIEDKSATDDSGTAIAYEFQGKDFTLQTRRHFPRWVKYDVDASGADECNGRLLLDAAIHHTHAITGNRNTRRRLVGEGNGNKAAVRIDGSGPVSIYSYEFE